MAFWDKIKGLITPKKEEDDKPDLIKLGDELSSADLDFKFAKLFTHSGGIFNYCGDETEALQTLHKIIKAEDIKSFFCWDNELKSFLDVVNASYTDVLTQKNDAAFITCECLIAYDGKIMLSSNNILNYNSAHLPQKIIVIANVSQIVSNLNEAMAIVKRRRGPLKNLTSISGSQSKLDDPNAVDNKLFLLLLED
ncbi:LUD domain-containing protein [Riemerella columbipharyngis]|uniref:Uncharacterized ACR, YkgG family COG1556 n=1 Tax=Riemerella columbipharyngis TaxID=1071918 RepID=A0A1G6YU68_9FLAO|nr:LUD domain-containing protein [Riemerella columbipharyngis]SDD93870.1 Uncharacterised ACR, YkgG family COG1556 [Riemerella columbipharyngis]